MAKDFFSPGDINNEHYRLLIEQVKDYAIFMLSPSGVITSWNTGAEILKGYKAEEVIGQPVSIFYDPGDSTESQVRDALNTATRKGHYEETGPRVRKDGSRFKANIVITPIYDAKNELAGFSNITRHISEQASDEDLLRSSEEFRVLADFLPHVVWTANSEGHIIEWNRSFYIFTGLDPSTVKDSRASDVVHPDDVQQLRAIWRDSVLSGNDFEIEFRLRSKEGVYHWHLGRAIAIKNRNGRALKWIGAAMDVHEQKMTMEKKDEFIGIAGHELRTPLTSMKAYVQLMQQSLESTDIDTSKKYAEKIHSFIDRLNKLVSDLLDISKIHRGKLPLEFSEFSIDDFIRDAVEVQQNSIQTHKITIEGNAGVKVRADQHRLEQVFSNYLSNAVKYSPGADKVAVIVEHSHGWVTVTVKDYGIGIPAEQIKQVFNKFFRAHNKKANIQGLGLGLYISSEIIKMHGGNVGVTSEEKSGSTFWFRLPVYSAPGPDGGAGENQNPSSFHA